MWIIRAALTILWVAAVLIIDLPLHLITMLIERVRPGSCTGFRHAYVHISLKVVWALGGGRATTMGLKNVPRDRAVLFVANHRSIFDVILTGSQISSPVGYIAKKELAGTPLGLIMTEVHCLFLDRDDARAGLRMVLTAIDYIKKDNISMFIFPEGTRSKVEGELLPFHPGSFKIATKAKCPIIPVTIVNTGDIFEDHKPRLKRAHVIIEYGTPIETADMDRKQIKELPDKVYDIIAETYKRNRELI